MILMWRSNIVVHFINASCYSSTDASSLLLRGHVYLGMRSRCHTTWYGSDEVFFYVLPPKPSARHLACIVMFSVCPTVCYCHVFVHLGQLENPSHIIVFIMTSGVMHEKQCVHGSWPSWADIDVRTCDVVRLCWLEVEF